MAAETSQQAQVGGDAPVAETPAAKAGGFSSYLPLVIAVVLMPVAAWVTLEIKSRMGAKSSDAAEEEHAAPAKKDAHGASGHGSAKKKEKEAMSAGSGERNTRLPIPLTRMPVAFVPKDETKSWDIDKIVVLDVKGETKEIAESEKVVVNIANTGGSRYAVARFSMMGDRAELIQRVNENRERLLDVATGVLSSKTMEDIEKPGFRNILRAELLSLFNQILGSGMVQEVIMTDFVVQ